MRSSFFVLTLLACQRIPGDTPLVALEEEQALELCASFHQRERRLDCGGEPITMPASDDRLCADQILALPPACPATVDDFRACMRARAKQDPCFPPTEIPDACAWQMDTRCFFTYDP